MLEVGDITRVAGRVQAVVRGRPRPFRIGVLDLTHFLAYDSKKPHPAQRYVTMLMTLSSVILTPAAQKECSGSPST